MPQGRRENHIQYRREIRKATPFALRVSASLKMTAEVASIKRVAEDVDPYKII